VRPVEAGQGLDSVHAAELLVHVHGVQQRLVEARLELVGDDEEPVLRALEGVPGLALGEAVELGLVDRPRDVAGIRACLRAPCCVAGSGSPFVHPFRPFGVGGHRR
jgi:hypothetical protein